MADVKLGSKIYKGVSAVKLKRPDGSTVRFGIGIHTLVSDINIVRTLAVTGPAMSVVIQ